MVKYFLTVNIHSANDLLGTLIVSLIHPCNKPSALWRVPFRFGLNCFRGADLNFWSFWCAKYILLRKLGKHGIFSIFTYSINITQGRPEWFINVKLNLSQ